ncbi:MAG: hypothetical protein KAR20_18860 [Candidatus Heimdallarchaeota archaeon]|nr:hypothetical protein [Candidatus Heimdallarchaeota archaeon]
MHIFIFIELNSIVIYIIMGRWGKRKKPYSHENKKELKIKARMDVDHRDFEFQKRIGRWTVDWLWSNDKYAIAIECDERMHMRYGKLKEYDRMMKIRTAYDKPITFIRFNPDCLRFYEGKVRFECVDYILNRRLDLLDEILEGHEQGTGVGYEVRVVWMFYDRFNDIVVRNYAWSNFNDWINKMTMEIVGQKINVFEIENLAIKSLKSKFCAQLKERCRLCARNASYARDEIETDRKIRSDGLILYLELEKRIDSIESTTN